MAYFVGDDFGDLLLYPNAAILVYKEHDLPKRDGSPVLHRSSGKLRDRDKMQLGKVVLRTKIGLEEFDRISGDAQRILRARTLAWHRRYYVVDSVEPVFHFFKLADSQVQEVRGHSRSRWKLDGPPVRINFEDFELDRIQLDISFRFEFNLDLPIKTQVPKVYIEEQVVGFDLQIGLCHLESGKRVASYTTCGISCNRSDSRSWNRNILENEYS